MPIKEVAGTFYYDRQENQTTWYYWIKLVSINGTYGDVIGPASAAAKPRIEEMLELLTGKIDAGVLATSLRTEIGRIGTLAGDLASEVTARENSAITLGQAVADAQAGNAQTLTFLLNEQASRVSGQNALALSIDQLAITSGANLAAAKTELRASITAVDGRVTNLATQVNQVESAASTNLAQAQTTLQTNINTVNGKVTQIGALYTAKVNVNGLIGGFGIYNDGTEVEAGFDVDRFWIGRTGANKRKPFIIDAGVVYIDEAAINKLTFSKLRDESGSFVVANGKIKANFLEVTDVLQSDNYAPGGGGFFMRRSDGYAEFGNIFARGNIRATSLTADSVTVENLAAGSLGRELAYFNENSLDVSTSNVWHQVAVATFSPRGGRPVHGTTTFAARQTGGRNSAEHRVRIVKRQGATVVYLYGGTAGAPFTTGYDGASISLAFVDPSPVDGSAWEYAVEILLMYGDDRGSFGYRSLFLRELSKSISETIVIPYVAPNPGGGGGGGGGIAP